MEEARRALALIEQLGVGLLLSVPTMLSRMARLPEADTTDLSSLLAVVVGAAACPEWLVRRWIGLIGPTKCVQAYGAAERQGFTQITGAEWLEHPGSVGTGVATDIRIVGSYGAAVPAGTVGEIYLRPQPNGPTYDYVGHEPLPVTADGFVGTGDLGWVDTDGYLYLADRLRDEIKTGGATVYPAEVEAVLTEHPDVVDATVVGLPDPEWGQRVHAVVQLMPGASAGPEALASWCRARLSGFKVPKGIEVVDTLSRTDAGKLNRSALAHERASGRAAEPG